MRQANGTEDFEQTRRLRPATRFAACEVLPARVLRIMPHSRNHACRTAQSVASGSPSPHTRAATKCFSAGDCLGDGPRACVGRVALERARSQPNAVLSERETQESAAIRIGGVNGDLRDRGSQARYLETWNVHERRAT